jgi:ubiquinone/menaquinone biosynthesis C-methylase UbiE
MLDLARIGPGKRVLDVAAGDGDQSLAAAARVGSQGYVLATDLTPEMLVYVRRAADLAGLDNLETRTMDGETLQLEDGTFDAVICRLGLMFFPDYQKGLAEMWRVLKPEGRAALVIFSTPERTPFFSIPISIIRRAAQLPQPDPAQPSLFKLGERGVLETALNRAGFVQVETHILSVPLRLPSLDECLRFEKEALPVVGQMIAGLDEAQQQVVWAEIRHALSPYQGLQDFSSPAEVIVGVGTK